MRIALTIHAMYGGGAERLMSQLATRWANAGHTIHLITWAAPHTDRFTLPASIQRHGLDLMRASSNRFQGLLANYQRVQKLRATLQGIQPEFVLSFCDQMNIVTLQATRSLNVPVWIAEHSNPAMQKLGILWERWRARTYPRCSGCIVLTQSIADYLSRWVSSQRILVIPNAIELPVALAFQYPSTAPQSRIVLALGRLSPEKGMDILIEAWRKVHSQLDGWKLIIAGDGPQRVALEKQSQGISSIDFLGWVDDPWSVYQQAQIFVLPSRYEGFPVALVEAMSQSLACIATRCTDAVDELSNNRTAVHLVATDSSAEIATAILTLANNRNYQLQLGAAARDISANYLWTKIGPRWDNLLQSPRVSG